MKKRALAAFLWFYAGWYVGVMLADVLGVDGVLLGPVIGAAAAGLIALDPRRIIWSTHARVTPTSRERMLESA